MTEQQNTEQAISTTIRVGKRHHALIDLEDYDRVSTITWSPCISTCGSVYARGRSPEAGGNKTVSMHRFIVGAKAGQLVDHRNGDTLDNRRCNLRHCNCAQNVHNQRQHKDALTSKYKGVSLDKDTGKYRAQIMLARKKIYLGEFASQEDAARCWDENARKLHGEFAKCNFPPPVDSRARDLTVFLAEHVMGWRSVDEDELVEPSLHVNGFVVRDDGVLRWKQVSRKGFSLVSWTPLRSIADSWMVIEALAAKGFLYNLNNRDAQGEPKFWPADHHCCFSSAPIFSGAYTQTDPRYHHGHGDTIMEAICDAAAKAIEQVNRRCA